MESARARARAVMSDAAISLLELKTMRRVAEGYDTLLLEDVNEVLSIAQREPIEFKKGENTNA